ncbi:DUF1476 domain-containing protein [Parvularcula oceani]|uniref:DUF1476 domain-containing protein n=1 Tax=Parvularcula oceani TaxID=1247963 RepID=UPI0004E10AC4|nr:DUF1476 domain-containing protein [Parvularcula oceani]
MTTFDDRERRFEAKFAHDAEARFKVETRRDRLIGAWAAEKLGLSSSDAEAYARSVVRADLKEPGDDDVFEKLREDLPPSISDEDIRAKMAECLDRAMDETRSPGTRGGGA